MLDHESWTFAAVILRRGLGLRLAAAAAKALDVRFHILADAVDVVAPGADLVSDMRSRDRDLPDDDGVLGDGADIEPSG